MISSLTHWWISQIYFCHLFLFVFYFGWRTSFVWFQPFYTYSRLFCGLAHGLSWVIMLHVRFGGVCTLLLLGDGQRHLLLSHPAVSFWQLSRNLSPSELETSLSHAQLTGLSCFFLSFSSLLPLYYIDQCRLFHGGSSSFFSSFSLLFTLSIIQILP